MSGSNLKAADSHFAFGENWAKYAASISDAKIQEAEAGLRRLLPDTELVGKRFLDIGSGSGLHSLAALRLGASEILAVDLDPKSVETTRATLQRFAPNASWRVAEQSVFDLSTDSAGRFDVVYSWGVLHHTGSMVEAIRQAAEMCVPEGLFVFALYRRVLMDWFWRLEKPWYSSASPESQARARKLFIALFQLAQGRGFRSYVDNYQSSRGMEFEIDVHDWMGGWPYESIDADEVAHLMDQLQFQKVRQFVHPRAGNRRNTGLFGSGCDEYVYRRITGASVSDAL